MKSISLKTCKMLKIANNPNSVTKGCILQSLSTLKNLTFSISMLKVFNI